MKRLFGTDATLLGVVRIMAFGKLSMRLPFLFRGVGRIKTTKTKNNPCMEKYVLRKIFIVRDGAKKILQMDAGIVAMHFISNLA